MQTDDLLLIIKHSRVFKGQCVSCDPYKAATLPMNAYKGWGKSLTCGRGLKTHYLKQLFCLVITV